MPKKGAVRELAKLTDTHEFAVATALPNSRRRCEDCGVKSANYGVDDEHGVWSRTRWCANCNKTGGYGGILPCQR